MTPSRAAVGLSPRALRLYVVLCHYADRHGRCWPKVETLAADVGASRATIHRALADLRAAGFLVTTRTRGRSDYRLTEPRCRTDVATSDGAEMSQFGAEGATSDVAAMSETSDVAALCDSHKETPPEPPHEPPPEVIAARSPRSAEVVAIDGGLFPEPERRDPTPAELTNDCRGHWMLTYTERHGRPDPSIQRQAFGRIRQLAKDRTDRASWVALWNACGDAGRAGAWQVAQYLGPAPQSRYTPTGSAGLRLLDEYDRYRPAQEDTWTGQPLMLPASSPDARRWTPG